MAAEKLRDLSQPIDVVLLDATVEAFYATGSKEEVSPSFLIVSRSHHINRSIITVNASSRRFYRFGR